ncbi:hypothetical protein, partial [Weissella hellenica]|uniref:hypothetical protein n=1 Tax=Weissella hellenica TaxID=46256 RepID=UPI001B3541C9
DVSAKIAETSFLNPWALSPQTQTKLSQLDRYRSPPLGSGKQGLVSCSSGFGFRTFYQLLKASKRG